MKTKTVFAVLFWILLPFRFSSADVGYVAKPFTLPSGLIYWAIQQVVEVDKAHASELSLRWQIENYIKAMADIYGADRTEMLETSNCESGWVKYPDEAITIPGDRGKSYGLWQYHKDPIKRIDTFARFAKLSGIPDLERTSWKDATRLSAWAFSQGETFKDDWTCYRDIFIKKTRPISTNWQDPS